MSTFNEEDHDRDHGGRFASKEHAEVDPGLGLEEPPSLRALCRNHDLLRGLPSYVEVTVTTVYAPDKPIRLMARDLPRGKGFKGFDGNSRRYTNLDAGTEWFIKENPRGSTEAGQIASVDINRESFIKNWPDAYSGPYGMNAEQALDLFERLHSDTDDEVTGTVTIGDFPDERGFEQIEGVQALMIDFTPVDMNCPGVYVRERPGDPSWVVPITHFSKPTLRPDQ